MMELIRHQEDVYRLTAEKTGYSVEFIKFVVHNYWETINKWLTHPLDAGIKIPFAGGFVFYFHLNSLGSFQGRTDWTARYGRSSHARLIAIEKQYYLNLVVNQLKKIKPDEGQTRKVIDNARFRSYYRREKHQKRQQK